MARQTTSMLTGEADLAITGMSCAACVGRVEKALRKLPAVATVSVNLATERAHVTLNAPTTADALEGAVSTAGYEAHWLGEGATASK
ncbi:MAG TPA: heavy metal-associated domain-containing protein, partial [Methylophilaceae bacterium]|nr:heavy metal-associated domain-containing protein [Methylophilaceae bacterium]